MKRKFYKQSEQKTHNIQRNTDKDGNPFIVRNNARKKTVEQHL